MVKTFFSFLHREVRGLHQAAYLLAAFALGSQLLGVVRDRLFAHAFGAGEALDVYFAAFRIPDLLFAGVASLVSFAVVIPMLGEKLDRARAEARAYLDSLFSLFAVVMVAASALAFVALPILLDWFFPGIPEEVRQSDLLALSRILLLSPFLLGASQIFASVAQVRQKFMLYAASPILYNFGIIVGVVGLYPAVGIAGLGFGVVLGALLHLAIQIPFIVGSGLFPRLSVRVVWRDMRTTIILSLPRTVALSASHLTALALLSLASREPAGSIAVFSLAHNIQTVPLTIIGVSYATAAFPMLTRLFARGDQRAFADIIALALRHIVFWSLPVLVFLVVLRAQVVRVLLGSGAFDWQATRLTAAALAVFALSVAAQSVSTLLMRGYYAVGRTRAPLLIALGSSAITIASASLLLPLFRGHEMFRLFVAALLRITDVPGGSVLMLALAYSLGAFVNAGALFFLFRRSYPACVPKIGRSFRQNFAASMLGGFAAFALLGAFDDIFDLDTLLGIFAQGFLSGVGGIAAWASTLALLKNSEIRDAWRALQSRFSVRPAVAPAQEEM